MTKNEFAQIVNSAAAAEQERLISVLKDAVQKDEPFESLIASIALQIPETSARTCAHILEQSGLISFDD